MTQTMPGSLEFVNEATPISDGVAHDKSIAFVNDWSELEWALHEVATEMHSDEYLYDCDLAEDCRWCPSEYKKVLSVFMNYVPRLLTQYAKLLELSYVLTDLVEKQNAHRTPEGIYLP